MGIKETKKRCGREMTSFKYERMDQFGKIHVLKRNRLHPTLVGDKLVQHCDDIAIS